jgi:signal transduction histidine kinase
VVEPVRLLADGKVTYNAEHGLDAPSDRDWASVMADPALGTQIAADYEAMQDYNAAAEPAYDALSGEVGEQFDFLTNDLGIKVEFMDRDPYENVQQLRDDIENGHLGVLRTDATPPGHPYLSNEVNDQFRAVHDAFGHAAIGRGFDRNGEEAAYQSHAEMFSAAAVPALASETRGQNSALNYGGYGARGEFAPQKFDLLPAADTEIDTGRTTLVAAMTAAAMGNADDDNLYEVTGSHHVSMGRSFSKPPLPLRPAERHTSLGRGRPAAVEPEGISRSDARLIGRLTQLRQSLGTRLLAEAEQAYEAALRSAGVKVISRARSRTSPTRLRQATTAVDQCEALAPWLAAIGLTEEEMLDHAFDTFTERAIEEVRRYRERQAVIVEKLGGGVRLPEDPLPEQVADFLVAGLTAMVRQRLLVGDRAAVMAALPTLIPRNKLLKKLAGQAARDLVKRAPRHRREPDNFDLPTGLPDPDELASAAARLVRNALYAADGRVHVQLPATPDRLPTVITSESTMAPSLEERLVLKFNVAPEWEWVHAFYGEPRTVFEPHEALDGFTTTDREGDPGLFNPDAWPEVDLFAPGDHGGCTCEWVVSVGHNEE